MKADDRYFVGPHNGLFEIICRRSTTVKVYRIDWHPDRLSSSFHGRDLFAYAAAGLANNETVKQSEMTSTDLPAPWLDWPDDLAEIIYIDDYGNCMTGLRAAILPEGVKFICGGDIIGRAATFSEMPEGSLFWYENSQGLVEIACNLGNASTVLKAEIGTKVTMECQR